MRNNHLFFLVDEYAQTAHQVWATMFRQARSREMSLGVFLQQASDLDQVDLLETISGNCAVRIDCAARDEASRDFWRRVGGERRVSLVSKSTGRSVSPTATTETEGVQTRAVTEARFNADRLNLVNADARKALLDVTPTGGLYQFTRPVVIELMPPCSKAKFDELSALLPLAADGVSMIAGDDLKHLFAPPAPGVDDEEPDAPDAPPEPEPPEPRAPKPRRRPRRPVDPDEAERARRAADFLKSLKDEDD